MKENLNLYKEAYHEEFKFNDENISMLGWYANRMCETIRNKNLKSVLSLGIGHRVVSQSIIELLNEKRLTKYDIVEGSPDIIKEYKTRFDPLPQNVNIIETYFEEWSNTKKYDAIEIGFVLEHVDDPALILSKYKPYLNEGGVLFAAVPNALSMHRQLGNIAGLLDDMYKLGPADLQLGHKRYFDVNTFKQLIVDAGLKIKTVEGIMLKPFTNDQMLKLNLNAKVYEAMMKFAMGYPEFSNAMYIEAQL